MPPGRRRNAFSVSRRTSPLPRCSRRSSRLPFGPDMTFEPASPVGVFWILAILSVEVMGVILAGWASNNKWSVYGAMREACQMVSYEIPLGISIIVGVMAAGTLNMVELGHMQGGGIHTWLIFRNPFVFVAFFVYFIASPGVQQAGALRPARNRIGAGRRFPHRILRPAILVLLLRRIRGDVRRRRDSDVAVPRRLERSRSA